MMRVTYCCVSVQVSALKIWARAERDLCSHKIKMLLLFLADYHSARSAESHETATLSHSAMHVSAQREASLNEQMFSIMRKSLTIFSSGCVKRSFQKSQIERITSRIMIQQKSILVLIKLYCRSLEIINENCCVTTFAGI